MKKRILPPLILLASVFLVFSPALFAEISSSDDYDLFARLEQLDGWGLDSLFFRKGAGLYYRPLVILSYQFDKVFWGLDPAIMHLENILLHAFNVLVLFYLIKRFVTKEGSESSFLPLVAALFFGLHPIAAESVNWISGRTDILAGSFVLSSVYLLVLFRGNHKGVYLFGAGLLFMGGMLCKEVSVALLPGFLCLLVAPGTNSKITVQKFSKTASLLWASVWVGTVFSGFLILRVFAYSGSSSRIGLTVRVIMDDLYYSLFVCLRALGFYIKKIFWPFPLNFAILEVDPLYELFGIVIVIFCIYLLWKRSALGALFLTGIFLITPSFLLAFNQIAWTPYAERYVYLPSAFILSATVIYVGQFVRERKLQSICSVVVVAVLLFWGGSAFARSRVWMTNLTLWQDTTRKSPLCTEAWNDYGVALHKDGRLDEAVAAFKQAASIRQLGYQETYDLNMANVFIDQGRFEAAKKVYAGMHVKSKGRSGRALAAWKELLTRQIEQADNPTEKESFETELKNLPVLVKNKNGTKAK